MQDVDTHFINDAFVLPLIVVCHAEFPCTNDQARLPHCCPKFTMKAWHESYKLANDTNDEFESPTESQTCREGGKGVSNLFGTKPLD